ncbi:ATP-binding cassette transporter [Kwoniella heveanensis BCC8398]|uniref:ATP-binding cassette transporter n=1 Tax=Kwoniella heveanensis BCC8398 TaxID=1296120 RepID=A0A1B9GKS3_9TREE|nr:ATP-binding cassette transporter [Kwoniella heveanensis BCC8398]
MEDANNAQSVFGVFSDVIEIQRKAKHPPPPFLLRHTLFFLPILVIASIIILFLSFTVPRIYRFIKSRIQQHKYQPISLEDEDGELETEDVEPSTPPPPPMPSGGLWSDFSAHIRSMKEYGSILFFLEVLRTLCIAALLGLSVYAAIQAESPTRAPHSSGTRLVDGTEAVDDGTVWDMAKHWGKHGKHKKKKKHSKSTVDDYSSLEWGEFGVCGFYVYTLFFSFLLLTLRPATPLRRHLITHVDTLLFLGWCLYAYRDLWPLLTYTLDPADINNAITWSRVAILSVSAVIIPLLRPRTYVPADPLHPTSEGEIHPEQTASWLSFVFYEFMSGLVWKAWKSPSLPYDQLHPLADYDRAEHLYNLHMDTLDPIRRKAKGYKDQNLLLSIGWVFRKEIVVICAMAALSSVAEMAGSVGINKLLDYLEKDGKGFVIRPIVWVVFLFLGPTLGSLTIQLYIFTTTRCLVRSEALLTQLLFDHALRLRMKDAIDDTTSDEPKASPPEIRIEEVIEPGPGNAEAVIGDGPESVDATEVGSADGSAKDKSTDKQAAADEEAKKTQGQGLAGKINVLMAADVESVIEGRDLALVFIFTPIQLSLCIVLLYKILSWSAIVGMLTMLITLPIPGLLTKKNAQYQNQRMLATDSRVDSITESIGALRMIKMFGWEDRVKERIAAKREDELHLIWQRRLMSLAVIILNNILPVLTMTVTFAMYTLVQGRQLTAATVFTSMTVFELVKGQMGMCFYLINEFVTGWVSLQRINKFLHSSEMIDEYSEGKLATIKTPEQLEAESEGLIRIHDAVFTWGPVDTGNTQDFSLKIPDVTFIKGKINLITGPTGSGKSSLLKALVGELHFEQKQGSFFHLPREGGVSYAAQESWCMSDSIKDNVLFGEPYEEDRYKKTLRACGLEPDLKLFDDGDETEVGEKGITLSGGQKARLTLARAVYSKTAVVLLDDIFSALDTLTSRWIIDNLLKGDLMKDRTVLLITHHIGLAAPVADFMLALNQDGTVKSQGPIEEGELPDEELEQEAEEDNKQAQEAASAEQAAEEKKPASKLIKDEEKGEGRISKRAMFTFFSTFGGPIFWLLYFILLLGGQGFNAFQTYWLGRWARAYDQAGNPKDVSAVYYLGLYVVWVLFSLGSLGASAILFYVGAVKASREMHRRLVESIFGAYMRFLDATPVGRIISRFTKDMKAIDGSFTETFSQVADITIGLILKFLVVIALVPFFSLPALAIGALGGFLGEVYIHGQLSVKREMSNAKSPLFSHFSAAVNGIVSIRAYGAQQKLRAEAQRKADKYTRAATARLYNLNRWVTVRIDMLGGVFAASLAAFLVYGPRLDASTSGFALSQAISFSTMILWWVRLVNEMEVQGNSVERIEDYLIVDQEPKSEPRKQPPAAWPTSGEIVLEKLSARYTPDGPIVLDKLDVKIASGEKVGIVGRTGSGKSTLALALLRMLPTEGDVYIDGLKTKDINLHALRSNVTIIPQDPVLLSGSLRFNLDPFGEHDDFELNDALQSSGLGQTRQSGGSGSATPQRLTLDTQIAAAGGNLSQGQRQLVALARALVRASKVLILDEATASVDFETDALIQQSIRNLPSSTTVLTVAHRLSTVMDYDKILVLGAGKVLEFDSPGNLRTNKDSYFAKLVQAMEGGTVSRDSRA